jgi:hypothetical protein
MHYLEISETSVPLNVGQATIPAIDDFDSVMNHKISNV